MTTKAKHYQWVFRARFRRHAFGWQSQPAIKRIKEATSEIKKVARKDKVLAAEGVVLLLERQLRGFFQGTTNCLSALLTAGRHRELLELLEMAPYDMWHYRQYGVRALAALGRTAEAIQFAEQGRGLNDSPVAIAQTCEELLLGSGCAEEAYRRYGLLANQTSTYLAWFRAVARKYPQKKPIEILNDLVATTPGEEGKWFAAAKDARLFDKAIALANQTPCSPQTLTRAARDFAASNPPFAMGLTKAPPL